MIPFVLSTDIESKKNTVLIMKIPKLLHQTWKTEEIPTEFIAYAKSWREKNPDWCYRLWSDRAIRNFIKANYPDFLTLYDSYDINIKRVDFFKYLVLYHYGGLYVDMDFECLKPFDHLLDQEDTCILGLEPEQHANQLYKRAQLTCNAIMASSPGHRFWEHVFKTLIKYSDKKDVLESTGPIMLQEAHDTYNYEDIILFPSKIFYPLVDINNRRLLLSNKEKQYYIDMLRYRSFPEESYAVHYWAGSWCHSGNIWSLGLGLFEKYIKCLMRILK